MIEFSDSKRGRILQASLQTFLTYGFRKTSMDDIAREAGVSRPALYQDFKNKPDIFRALSDEIMNNALIAAKAAFQDEKPLREQLHNFIDKSILDMHRFVDQTPHGHELIGVNQEIGCDLEAEWKQDMVAAIAEGIDRAVANGRANFDSYGNTKINSRLVGLIMMQTIEGLKEIYLSGEPIEEHMNNLVDFVAGALTPQPVKIASL